MTRHIPEGNSLRPLRNAADILREGFDVWPADADERRIDDFLRRTRARPVAPRPVPWLVPFLFGAAAMALAVALAFFAVDAVQTGAAAAVEAERVAGW